MRFWMFDFSFEVQTPQRIAKGLADRKMFVDMQSVRPECGCMSPFSERIIGFEIRLGVQQELRELRIARPSHLELAVSSRQ